MATFDPSAMTFRSEIGAEQVTLTLSTYFYGEIMSVKFDWERVQRNNKASKTREIPSYISGVSVEPKQRRKKKSRDKPSPIVPTEQGVRKCKFCSTHYRNVAKHEKFCEKNPNRIKLSKLQRKLLKKMRAKIEKRANSYQYAPLQFLSD